MMRAGCKFLPFVAAVALLLACSSSSSTPNNSGGDDDDDSTNDSGTSQPKNDAGSPTTDAGGNTDSGGNTDAGGDSGGGGKAALGETCNADGDCESDACFKGGQQKYCSLKCTQQNAATICVAPTFNGVCNNQGYCRKP